MFGKVIDQNTKSCMVCENCTEEEAAILGLKKLDVEKAYNGTYYLKGYTPEKSIEEKKADVRADRDNKLNCIFWRVERYQTQREISKTTTDDQKTYTDILNYLEYLRKYPESSPLWYENKPLKFDDWAKK